jgi:hypothetical protein
MRPLVVHCHHGLGLLYAAIGQHEKARTALTTAIELCRAMEMACWLPQAEPVLARVGRAMARGKAIQPFCVTHRPTPSHQPSPLASTPALPSTSFL